MPFEEHQSCTHSKMKKPHKYGKKINKKNQQKHASSRNRVPERRKRNYSPEYKR